MVNTPEFKNYIKQVKVNAKVLAAEAGVGATCGEVDREGGEEIGSDDPTRDALVMEVTNGQLESLQEFERTLAVL